MDRGGVVGADGPTHHGVFDLSYLRCIPGMVIMAPKDEQELRDMLYTAIEYKKGPIAMRYPRGNALGVPVRSEFKMLEIGKAETVRKGRDVAILAIGNMTPNALGAAELLAREGIEAEVVNMRFVKPLDEELLKALATRFDYLLTVEDHTIRGGFGSAVLESLATQGLTNVSVRVHGIPDQFVEHGTPAELHRLLKLDAHGIAEVTKELLTSKHGTSTMELIAT
jgi:1-deoxy-D-xylulose-5-phosphate synthase